MDEEVELNSQLNLAPSSNTTTMDAGKAEIAEESVALIEKEEAKPEDGFGEKEITFFGGWSLLLNNITGPAMTVIPIIYQEAGWLTPTLAILLIMVVSSLASMMLCRAMSLVPGNDKFQARYELTSLAKFYFPRWGYWLTLVLFLVSLQAMNITAIVESAQTMDLALVAVFNYTGAVEAWPHPGWARATSANIVPFEGALVLSIGFVVVLALCLPMGYFNLDDNIIVQEVSMWLFFIILIQWFVDFFLVGFRKHVPVVGYDQSHVLGTVIFNYAFVITVPSWVNEKKPGVSIGKTIWAATGLSTVLYIIIGWMGASVFHITETETLLNVINSQCLAINGTVPTAVPAFCPHLFGKIWQVISRVLVYLFPAVVLMSGIPVFSIIVRYNLIQTNLCGKAWANFWAVVFPWVISVVVYTGSGLQLVINWTSLLVNGVVNFIIPITLYLLAERAALALSDAAEHVPRLASPAPCAEVDEAGHHGHAHHKHSQIQDSGPFEREMSSVVEEEDVEVLPPSLQPILLGWVMVGITTILLLITIGLNIATTIKPHLFEPADNSTATIEKRIIYTTNAVARFRRYYR